MDKVTRDLLQHYRARTIAACVMASGASLVLIIGYILGIL